MPELRIAVEKVCSLIEAAREIAGKVPPTTGDRTTTGDDSPLVSIEDYPGEDDWDGDDRRREMVELIAGLNVDEQVDLLALIMLGRGDYEFADWAAAVDEAEGRIAARDPDYMIGDAALPEYLGDGLEAFGRTCD
jgi:hypothetical protein